MALLIRLAAFWLLLSLLSAGSAFAQITITEEDLTATVGKRIGVQTAEAELTTEVQAAARALLEQDGPDQTFDFTAFDYSVEFEGLQERFSVGDAPSDVPYLDRFISRGAETVIQSQFNLTGTESDSTVWSFDSTTPEEFVFYGNSFVFSMDIDQDGDSPDSVAFEFDPGLLRYELPLEYEGSWSQQTEFSSFPTVFPVSSSDRESIVDGWGKLVTEAGTVDVLRVKTTTVDTMAAPVPGLPPTVTETIDVDFIARDFSLVGSLSANADGQVTSITITTLAEAGESYTLSQGETPTLTSGELGTRIQFTQGSSTAGTLDIFRYDTSPFNNTFSGSANSDDGSTITPNTVWQGWYVSIRNLGLQNFATDVCLDISSLGGVLDASKLVLLRRGTSDDAWTALASFLSGDFLCSSGVTGFSQFAIGSNSDTNPLPVELTRFTAEADGRDALLQWETATETNNAGFAVEHRAPGGAWRDVQFVEGAGTTTEATRYAFRVRDLAVGTHAFRLRQTDLDGTTQRSAPQVVAVRPASAFVLTTVDPHPVRGQGTLRLAVEETQDVTVEVFDVLGRRVQTLHSGPVAGGSEVMLALDASALPNGFYLVRAAGAQHRVTHRITVLK